MEGSGFPDLESIRVRKNKRNDVEEDLLVVSPLTPVRTVGSELPLQPPSLSAGATWFTRATRSTRSSRCLHSRHSTGLGRRWTTGTGWSTWSTCRWFLYDKKTPAQSVPDLSLTQSPSSFSTISRAFLGYQDLTAYLEPLDPKETR